MLSLAKKKELEAQEKPEFLPDDKLRPWVANPAAEEQVRSLVEDLEKMLALGSPVKEEHGASEIDRQIGVVDEDLLQDEETPPSDFPFPSQAFLSFLKRQEQEERRKALVELEERDQIESAMPLISEDVDIKRLLEEDGSDLHAPAAAAADEVAAPDREEGRAAQPLPTGRSMLTARSMTQRRLQAIRRERMKTKEEVDEKRVRLPSSRTLPTTARGLLYNHQTPHNVKPPSTAVHKKRRPMSSASSARKRAGPEDGVVCQDIKPFPNADGAWSDRSRPASAAHSVCSSTGSQRSRHVGIRNTPEPVPTRRAAWTAGTAPAGQPSSSSGPALSSSDQMAPPSSRRVVVGDMLGSATPASLSTSPAAMPLSAELIDKVLQQQDRPASGTSERTGHHYHQPYVRPYADINAKPRPHSSSSSRSSGVASDGTVEVYQFSARDWKELKASAASHNAVASQDQDTYKKRSQALKQDLARYEAAVLRRVDPKDLRTEMKIKGRVDHVWKVFVDPTITQKELKEEIMVSQTRLDHSFNEHFERQIRQQRVLFPEFMMKQSKEAAWAENALANRIRVFESGTWPRKPGR